MGDKIFNINNYVRVLLTEKGMEVWREDFNKYASLLKPESGFTFEEYAESHRTENSYYQFQMHDFMGVFGEKIGMYNLMNTNILIYEKDLTEIK
jgi:hypothetical protein